MKRYLIALGVVASLSALIVAARTSQAFLYPQEAVDTQGRALADGALISASDSGDPDIFIIKFAPVPGVTGFGSLPDEGSLGYKRLFLNPAIFGMYGHLGGFANVRRVTPRVRDAFATSGLFRNCETADQRVWATEVTGEDAGILHHVEMTGDQARAEDPFFFHKVFCINSREDNFYARSVQPYRRLADVPVYHRPQSACRERPACLDSSPQCLLPEPAEGWCPRPACIGAGEPADAKGRIQCCPGLVHGELRPNQPIDSASVCVRPGCYYQEVQCVRAPCDPVLVCPSPTPTPTSGPCYVGGCSGQLCTDRPDAVSTCEWRNEYSCYPRHGRCERQSGGQCGWTSTSALNSCVANPPAQ